LGIGCGGMVKILLQPVHANNDYLNLDELNSCLEQRQKAEYHQQIDEVASKSNAASSRRSTTNSHKYSDATNGEYFCAAA
jgi:hypothetical protein